MTDGKKEPSKGGRPTSYKEEYLDQVYKLSLLGLTDAEMADVFGVTEATFNNWKSSKSGFFESIKKGKKIADADIAHSLYERAKGYSHPDIDIRVIAGQIVKTELIKYYPPDTGAAFIWLKNRQGDRWRDKSEVTVDSTSVADALKDLADKLPD